ncbi:hypothetical protein DY000_02031285 [Brassica cretica]|uniref:Uncharacterized protein n=1 Tax=Brassica cretica TaxID=69181 RepID=A0ABQ7DZE6_BRACR|nr:hypothetical protein DY000_02031285 [Brassica cretica]
MGSKLCVWVQMTDQDTVMILTGNWVREDDEKWVFDSLNEEGTEFVTLKAVGGSFGVPVSDIIPYRRNGIYIRENQPIVRLRSQTTSEANHWKGKAVVVEVENGSKADDYVVPESLCRHENTTEEGETRLTQWPRFQDALHQFLDDESSQNVLFSRDVPPVVDGVEKDGIEAALEAVPYEGDNLFVGQVFKSKSDCKIKIAIHAINRKFHFKTKRFVLLEVQGLDTLEYGKQGREAELLPEVMNLVIFRYKNCQTLKKKSTERLTPSLPGTKREWKKIIQVTRWMLSKGQERTMGSHFSLLNALAEDNRLDEAEELWNKLFMEHLEGTPRKFFNQMISIYYKREIFTTSSLR